MISISTVNVINAQNRKNVIAEEELTITEKETNECTLCTQLNDEKNIELDYNKCNVDFTSLGWFPGKITICMILFIMFFALGNIRGASDIVNLLACTIGCRWCITFP